MKLLSRRDFIHAGCAVGAVTLVPSIIDRAKAGLHFHATSANASNQPSNFASQIQPSYDATKTVNVLTLQFGGGNPGDLTNDPATVTAFYNNQVGIAQKWKALGPGTKVVVLTTFAYGCADAATVTNFSNANALLLANSTDFDAVVDMAAASSVFAPSTSCPAAGISADCNHLTQTGSTLPVSAFVASTNSVY